MQAFCRDCLADAEPNKRCARCGSPRLARHPELHALSIAHIDCDAFYATIEKRDDPSLADKPLIVGGARRGVVTTACYIARTFGVRSAMPMFQALKLCPHATVVKPSMAKYVGVSREVRALMLELTPLVEPVSIDEAFLDLSGTERLHGMSPARLLVRLAKRIEAELGITVSTGLAPNKFLAKIASDLDKPRGFAAIGQAEAAGFLAPKPVAFLWGIGKAAEVRLKRDGFHTIADLQRASEGDLMRRLGTEGQRLARLSRGIDTRRVSPERETKSVSAETTFHEDLRTFRQLEKRLWLLSERVSGRLKAKGLAGTTITLKLKTADFRILTRARTLPGSTALADDIFSVGRTLLRPEATGRSFRLLGIGVSNFHAAETADLLGTAVAKRRVSAREQAVDSLRRRFGPDAVIRGLTFKMDASE
jgi:DNA polymerase-4